ncbi:MAG: alpha-glucosidase C-terminal domain-containing protein, partial [Bacteroidota bacterium]
EFQRMGDGHLTFAVLTATFDGMPLVYTGQESAMDKQLEFFVKDSIPWGDYEYADFYRRLFELKHRNQALWNGEAGGALQKVPSGNDENIYAFVREKEGDKVLVILNLSSASQNASLGSALAAGSYREIFSEESQTFAEGAEMELKPWEYRVYEMVK